MATITKKKAVDRLVQAMKYSEWYDLVEYHNELFLDKYTTTDAVKANPAPILKKIMAYIRKGLECEEILSLWNVVFPGQRNVWFDDEEEMLHYEEMGEPLELVD